MSSYQIIEAGEVASPEAAPAARPAPSVAQPTPAPKTPTQVALETGPVSGIAIGATGRVYKFRQLTAFDIMRITKFVGPDLVSNSGYTRFIETACSITHIDNEPIARPVSIAQAEMLVQRISPDYRAILSAMALAYFGPEPEGDGNDE